MAAWTLTDTETLESLTFELNPTEDSERAWDKPIVYAAKDRTGVIVFEEQPRPGEVAWRGALLSRTQRDTMAEWWDRRVPLTRVTDLGESTTIYIDQFEATRRHSISHEYYAEYTMHALVLA